MWEGDWASLTYYSVFLVLLGSALIVEFSGRGSQALRQLALWVVIFVGVAFGASLWFDWQSQPTFNEDGRIEIPISDNGHFYLTAEANGEPIRFLVDTGSTAIALSTEDAQRIGIDTDSLYYMGSASTANGTIRTASVTIDEFRVGDVVDYNVVASIGDGPLWVSLLGMQYLSGFARVSFEGDTLVLEP